MAPHTNLGQFALLVAVNAFVGGMVGQERTVLPLLAERVFGLGAVTAALTGARSRDASYPVRDGAVMPHKPPLWKAGPARRVGATMYASMRWLPSATRSVLVVLSPLAACGPGAAEQAASPGRSKVIEVASPSFLRLTSPAFGDGDVIPSRYGCDGANVSPPLAWSSAPNATQGFALLVTDPDARGFVHWVSVDIPASSSGLGEGASGSGAAGREGRNDFGRTGWGGPCPPSGAHRYVFDLFALSAPLGLAGTPSAADVRRALPGRVLAEARLTGTYRRGSR